MVRAHIPVSYTHLGGRRYLTDGVRHGILAVFSGPGNDAGNIRGHHAFVGDDGRFGAGGDHRARGHRLAGGLSLIHI